MFRFMPNETKTPQKKFEVCSIVDLFHEDKPRFPDAASSLLRHNSKNEFS
jgi:hypothetical protein